MNDLKEKLNDTKYLLEESECKSINMEEYSALKNNNLNNTQLLLEDKSSILYDIPNDNINNNINLNYINNENIYNNKSLDKNINNVENDDIKDDIKPNIDNSIKEIMKSANNEEIEKIKNKDEQEIIKQQNILLNNQSSHLEELFSLSYTELSHNNPSIKIPTSNTINTDKKITNLYISNNSILSPLKDVSNNNKTNDNNNINSSYKNISEEKEDLIKNNKKIYFGIIFPTEKIIKNIYYKNDDKKKIICFNIAKNKNDNYNEYFNILIDKNKNYYNLKANEEISIKISLEIPFLKNKIQINCQLDIIDINNNFIGAYNLYANVEIPKLCCLRYKNILKECNIPLIKINLGPEEYQKFIIPFKNLSIKDFKINFNLINSPKEDNINKYIDYEIILDSDKNMIIPSLGVNYLNCEISIKKRNDINENINFIKIKKIIEGNIDNTKINYYFCLELLLNINNDIKNKN